VVKIINRSSDIGDNGDGSIDRIYLLNCDKNSHFMVKGMVWRTNLVGSGCGYSGWW